MNKDVRVAVVKETKEPTRLIDHIQYLFSTADIEDSGELTSKQFRLLITKLGLGVDGEQVESWIDEINIEDENGNVQWVDFEESYEEYLEELLGEVEFEDPWVEIEEEGRRSFRYNRETTETEWSDPVGYWVETVDDEGCQCWHNEVTDETVYEDPSKITVDDEIDNVWIEKVNDDNTICWVNKETEEISFENPNIKNVSDVPQGLEKVEDWVVTTDEEGYQCWYNKLDDVITYENPNGDDDLILGEGNGWIEGVDEEGYQYWYNQDTGESTYDDPNSLYGDENGWIQSMDEQGYPYWSNSKTGESTYDDPYALAVVEENSALTREIATYVSTNEQGNRLFSLSRVPQDSEYNSKNFESFQESIPDSETDETFNTPLAIEPKRVSINLTQEQEAKQRDT